MATFIKKQILKHLTKFAKNLSADKINLSTLRGEGELTNLELDCIALQNVMNLPTWLKIENACCNRVHVKIPWTKLKTTPISIFLDVVEVEMVACEEPREPNGPSPIQASASSGQTSYGFTVKVLEGMTVHINSITVDFKSLVFNANLQLSQLVLESTNPKWKRSDLRHTYIHDKNLDQVLTFKKMSWQTMRVVANAVPTSEKNSITPLRLITNQSEIMITFRRKASDCSIIASCLHLHFDDLLWVLTDSQVQSALLCMKALREMMERSDQQMRRLGLEKQDAINQPPPTPPPQPTKTKDDVKDEQYASKHFHDYLILETSFHVDFDHVDLHICEESSPTRGGPNQTGIQGGAIQISLRDLKFDHYPYHKPASDRNHFRDHGEVMRERDSWASGIIKRFRSHFAMLREAARSCGNLQVTGQEKKQSRLAENCLSVRLTDVEIHQVTLGQSKNQASGHLIRSTRKELHLPDDMLLFHFIHTKYYYPDGRDYPAPSDNTFMQINAPLLHLHWDTLIWLNRLTAMTVSAVQKMLEDMGILPSSEEDAQSFASSPEKQNIDESPHMDVKIQILMPKIFVPGPTSTCPTQPLGLEIQASRATVTNCREGCEGPREQLCEILDRMELQHLAKKPYSFPCDQVTDMPHLNQLLKDHSVAANSAFNKSFNSENVSLTRKALIDHAKDDVWSVNVDNVWIDFVMPPSKKRPKKQAVSGFLGSEENFNNDPLYSERKTPFIDSFPAFLWISKSSSQGSNSCKLAMPGHCKSKTINSDSPCSPQSEMHAVLSNSSENGAMTNGELLLSPSCMDSPNRTRRNKKLWEFYQSTIPNDSSSMSQDSDYSSTYNENEVISTYILLHSQEPVRLQVDHHQYIFLMSLPDMFEEVSNRLEVSSRVPSLSDLSTDSPSPLTSPYRVKGKKVEPVNTISVRIDTPSADLFLILQPPDDTKQNVEAPSRRGSTLPYASDKSDTLSEGVSTSNLNRLQDLAEDIRSRMGPASRIESTTQDSPAWSESGSESVSIQGSDINVSVSGDSYQSNDEPLLDHISPMKLPSVQGLKSESIPTSPSNQSLDSEKSKCEMSLENQTVSLVSPLPKEFQNSSRTKGGSSGYESGSYESIPQPENPRYAEQYQPRHSHTSSDASEDQFEILEIEKKETVEKDLPSVRFTKGATLQSNSSGETSSISSQTIDAPPYEITKFTPGRDSPKDTTDSDTPKDTNHCDTPKRVTGCDTPQFQAADSETASLVSEKEKPQVEQKIGEDKKEMCSLVLLHISNGVEVAVDTNDSDTSIVKLNGVTVNASELGTMDSRKIDSIFPKYSAKKVSKLMEKEDIGECGTDVPNFSLRVDMGPLAARFSPLAVENGQIQLTASSIPLNLKASTLGNIGAFFEEEGPSKVSPMLIEASDVKLGIEIDTPSASQESQPFEVINLLVHSAIVQRTDDGTFHINSLAAGKEKAASLSTNNSQMYTKQSKTIEKDSNNTTSDIQAKSPDLDQVSQKTLTIEKDLSCQNGDKINDENSPTVECLKEENLRLKALVQDLSTNLRAVENERDTYREKLTLITENSSPSS